MQALGRTGTGLARPCAAPVAGRRALVISAAHKKGAGSTKNGRDSNSKARGVKVYGGQPVKAGGIIVRQLGSTVGVRTWVRGCVVAWWRRWRLHRPPTLSSPTRAATPPRPTPAHTRSGIRAPTRAWARTTRCTRWPTAS